MTHSLLNLLRDAAQRHPQREAVVLAEERMSYAQLWRDVCAVAAFLRQRGLTPGERVALFLENSPQYVVAYYGALAAGGTVVALNTAAKERDLYAWIAHCGARWLFGNGGHPLWTALLQGLKHVSIVQIGGTVVDGASAWDGALAGVPAPMANVAESAPDAPAAIIYTSGTTGQPKGVTLSQRNLAANVHSILGYLPIRPDTRTLNVLPFYYSFGNSVLHTHLAVGACLVLENSLTYPHRVVERMVRERITGFNGVPSTYALLLNRVKLSDYDLSGLRYVTQAGGAMAPALTRRLAEQLPRAQLFIMYGQTEATARLSYLPPEKLAAKIGSVGVAIPGVCLEVRGDNGQAVSRDVPGEIWARGDNVMLGYWGDPETSATVLQDGWLRTGDLGYMDGDGYLFLQGRRSDMIKSGAHRINPNDIEEAINEIDGVAEVAVVGVDDDILGQVIKAVIVVRPGHALDVIAIKAHCRDRLAAYKIPKYIEFASELPKTASGKVKRFELAATGAGQHSG